MRSSTGCMMSRTGCKKRLKEEKVLAQAG